MCVSLASFSTTDSSFSGMPRFKAFKASARYIAPLSRYKYCKSSATRRATLLFPEPAGPSMAIVSLGINALRDSFPMRSETHDVIAAIDVNRFAGDAGTCIGKQEGGSSAYLGRVDIALQGCAIGMRLEHIAQPCDGTRGKRLDGPRGNGIDANALRPQVVCQIAHARFQCRLGHAHHVVFRHDFFCAVIRQRDDSAACRHQRSGRARHGDERIYADVVRDAKSFARGVEELALQFLRGRESHAVHDAVQHAVSRFQFLKELGDLLVRRDVAHETRGTWQIGDQILRFLLEPLVLVGNRQPPAGLVQFLRNGPRDAALVGEAEDHCRLLRVAHSVSLPMAELRPGAYKKSNSM